jgi:hypothetical protein
MNMYKPQLDAWEHKIQTGEKHIHVFYVTFVHGSQIREKLLV